MWNDADILEPCSEAGAKRLAARIKDYWIARGFRGITTSTVAMKVSPQKLRDGGNVVYGVVSNIGPNGYPPR